jgi:hypothetical protein
MLQHDIHSTYGPTADTGGPFLNAPTLYAYPDQTVLLAEEADVRHKDHCPVREIYRAQNARNVD